MVQEEELFVKFSSSKYLSIFKEMFTNLKENNKNDLRKSLLNFSSLYEGSDQFILKNLIREPFYKEFLNKVLTTDYSENSELLASSLIAFFEAIEDLFWWMSEIIAEWDTPAGPPDPEYCYGELVPELIIEDGKLNLYHNTICYSSVLKKLSQSLNDGGLLVKTAIYDALSSYSLLELSNRTVESLDRETVIDIFKENFEGVKNYSDMSRVFNGLKNVISTDLIEDFRLKDLIFTFLNKKDAKVIKRLNNLIPGGLKFGLHNPSESMPFSNNGVIINFNKQVISLQLRNVDLEDVLTSIFKLEKLQALSLLNVKIRELPETIGKLTCLEFLNLSNRGTHYWENELLNTLQNLPKSIGNLKKLKLLYLSDNKITEIKGIDELSSLQELSFYGCKITEIKNLDRLTNLTSLDLGGNQITEIKGLETLTSLKNLELGNNQIREITGLETLTRLNTLDLQSNQITEVKGLGTLTRLDWFSLLNNPVTEDSDVFRKLKIVKFERSKHSPSFRSYDTQKLVKYCKNVTHEKKVT